MDNYQLSFIKNSNPVIKHFGLLFINEKLYTKAASWMLSGENIFLFGHGYVGIDLSNINGAVSKHFLYVTDVDICFQQAGGKGMTEHVRRDMHFYRCQGSVLIDHSSDGLVRQCYAGLFDKEVITGLHLRKEGGFVFFQYAKDRVVSELDLSLLCTFSIDQYAFFIQIYVVHFQRA